MDTLVLFHPQLQSPVTSSSSSSSSPSPLSFRFLERVIIIEGPKGDTTADVGESSGGTAVIDTADVDWMTGGGSGAGGGKLDLAGTGLVRSHLHSWRMTLVFQVWSRRFINIMLEREDAQTCGDLVRG